MGIKAPSSETVISRQADNAHAENHLDGHQ